ncbi:MAG: hypothetical protein ACRDRQ_12095 [Pseudonocardiaceae bacterium]
MTGQARQGKTLHAISPLGSLGDEGAERYMWAFSEGDQVVLAIPGLRDLTLDAHEARTVGIMLIQTADEITEQHRNHTEGGERNGSPEEYPTDS